MPPKKAGKRKTTRRAGVIRVTPQLAADLKRFVLAHPQIGGSRYQVMEGSGLWDTFKNIGSKIVSGLGSALGFLKDSKIVSTVAPILGHPNIGAVAGQLGFGEAQVGGARMYIMPVGVHRKLETQLGSGFMDQFKKFAGWIVGKAKKARDYAKETQVISKGLDAYGKPEWATAFRQSGYGNQAVTAVSEMFRS